MLTRAAGPQTRDPLTFYTPGFVSSSRLGDSGGGLEREVGAKPALALCQGPAPSSHWIHLETVIGNAGADTKPPRLFSKST